MAQEKDTWFLVPARWALWLIGPGPRIWWHLFDESKASALASVVVQSFAAFLTALTARFLGEVGYGQLATLATCVGWFGILASYPTNSLLARFMADGKETGTPCERQCATGLFLSLTFGAGATLVGLAMLRTGLRYYNVADLFPSGMLLCLLMLLGPSQGFCLYLLQCSGRLRSWAVLNLVFGSIPIASVCLATWLFPPFTVQRYALALVAAYAVNAVLAFAISAARLGRANLLRPDLSVAPRLLRAGFGGWVATVACSLALLSVSTMIAKRIGQTELGHYQLIVNIGGWVFAVIMCVAVPTLASWSALAAQGRLQSLRRSLRLWQSGTGAAGILLAVAAVFLAPWLLEWLYGPAYRGNAGLLRFNALSWIALGFGCWYWIALTALGRPGRVMYSNLVWSVTQVAVCGIVLYTTRLGTYAAMTAYVVAYYAWLLAYEVVFRRTLRAESLRPGRGG